MPVSNIYASYRYLFIIKNLLDINRYNICIMAYGQTGSGKTHTMLGSHKNEDYNPSRDPHRDEGVIPRAARELFRSVWDSGKTG